MDLVAFENMRAKLQPKTLVYVGRLSKEKRVDRLLVAWSRLQHHHLDWRINLVGDGGERKTLEDLSSQLGISRSVQFSGWTNDVWEPLRFANAFCLVSNYEGFPQSMLEAMASGLPVAVMDCSPSIRQTIVDGINGLIISSEDQIAAVLDKLFRDESLRRLLGKKAAESAREYEWSNIAPRWLNVIG